MLLGLGLPCSGTGSLSRILSAGAGRWVGHERPGPAGVVDWQLIYPKAWERKPFGLVPGFGFADVTKVVVVERDRDSMAACFERKVMAHPIARAFIAGPGDPINRMQDQLESTVFRFATAAVPIFRCSIDDDASVQRMLEDVFDWAGDASLLIDSIGRQFNSSRNR